MGQSIAIWLYYPMPSPWLYESGSGVLITQYGRSPSPKNHAAESAFSRKMNVNGCWNPVK